MPKRSNTTKISVNYSIPAHACPVGWCNTHPASMVLSSFVPAAMISTLGRINNSLLENEY